jgi:hypothetical protein
LKDHNDMHLQLKYKMEAENNQWINFLDLCKNREIDEFTIGFIENLHLPILLYLWHLIIWATINKQPLIFC